MARKVSQWHILNKVSREWAPAVLVALVILVVQVDPEVPVVLRGAALECSQCAGPVTRLAGRLHACGDMVKRFGFDHRRVTA